MLPSGVGVANVALPAHHHLEQFLGIAHRQGFQDYRVDQTKDRGIGSDSKGERKNRGGGEAGTSAQAAEGIAKILKNGIEHNTNSMTYSAQKRA
jgi:hypothetical protein